MEMTNSGKAVSTALSNGTAEQTTVPSIQAIQTTPQTFRQLVRADFDVWCRMWAGQTDGTPKVKQWKNRLSLLLGQCGLRATITYRISHALREAGIPFLPGVFARMNLTLYGLDIPPSVIIGPGLYIPHPVGTVVMAQRIGANASLIASITIGMRNERAFPVLGDRVFVGAGARILGGIEIGDDAQIGANAVVVKDVPAQCTAVGIPARIVPAKNTVSTGKDLD